MAVGAEALPGSDPVLVDDAKRSEPRVLRIIVIGEGKRMPGVEPAVLGMPALLGLSDPDHGHPSICVILIFVITTIERKGFPKKDDFSIPPAALLSEATI
jgi:hypothetical protein